MHNKALEPTPEEDKAAIILIVDDQAEAREPLAEMLQFAEYFVLKAATVAEGIEIARNINPDLILLDWMLDDDRTAADFLQNLKKWSDIPVIVWSSKIHGDEIPMLQQGIYFVKATIGNRMKVAKFVKQNE